MPIVSGIHHISLSTRNMEGQLAFYRDLLGLRVVSDVEVSNSQSFDRVVGLKGAKARGVMLQAGNTHIEFWEYHSPTGRDRDTLRLACDVGITHICFDVSDSNDAYRRLTEAGIGYQSAPQDLGSVTTAYARDPDGNLVELRQGKRSLSKVELDSRLSQIARAILAQEATL
jgi:glyoxylase I family protein